VGFATDLHTPGPKHTLLQEGVGFAMPIVTLESGQSMSQTPAILDVLGETLGLGGATPEQKAHCKQLIVDMVDLGAEAVGGKFVKDKPERADKWLGYIEKKVLNLLPGTGPLLWPAAWGRAPCACTTVDPRWPRHTLTLDTRTHTHTHTNTHLLHSFIQFAYRSLR
jgi:hypothetical protein